MARRAAGVDGMVGGQLLDITCDPHRTNKENYMQMIAKKTGALIGAAVEIGAILGGANRSQHEALLDYGKNIGLAFQTRDDILDAAEDKAEEKKPRPNSA